VRISGKDMKTPTTNQYLINYWHDNIYGKREESENTEQLLHDWYQLMDLEQFKLKYPMQHLSSEQTENIELQHYQWIDDGNVYSTPTFFINGFQLPKDYIIIDLLAIIPGLSESIGNLDKKEISLQ
jgi:hypothetical protein